MDAQKKQGQGPRPWPCVREQTPVSQRNFAMKCALVRYKLSFALRALDSPPGIGEKFPRPLY